LGDCGLGQEAYTDLPPATVTQILRFQAFLRLGQREVPVNVTIELTPELLHAFREATGGISPG
jgi:hypothetical protein